MTKEKCFHISFANGERCKLPDGHGGAHVYVDLIPKKCDGNHGGPPCADPECWNTEAISSKELVIALVRALGESNDEVHNNVAIGYAKAIDDVLEVLRSAPESRWDIGASMQGPPMEPATHSKQSLAARVRALFETNPKAAYVPVHGAMLLEIAQALETSPVETPASPFVDCEFIGPPPEPFESWNAWAAAPQPYTDVEIRARRALKTSAKPWTMGGDPEGTHRVGLAPFLYSRIVKVFGEPQKVSTEDGERVCFEWIITFADGTIASIYDYKASVLYGDDPDAPTPEEMKKSFTDWHIGGKSERAAELVLNALNGGAGHAK